MPEEVELTRWRKCFLLLAASDGLPSPTTPISSCFTTSSSYLLLPFLLIMLLNVY